MLSKSNYLNGLQCQKLVWHIFNSKETIPKPDQATLALFEQGVEVGKNARLLFPGGVEVAAGVNEPEQVAELSVQALGNRTPLFEAGFSHSHTFARADILVPMGKKQWDIVEVKSSAELKDVHLHDAAFQTYVCKGAGVNIRHTMLLLIDNTYVRKGDVDPKKLFKQVDVSQEVKNLQPHVESNVKQITGALDRAQSPNIPIGPQCDDPYPCMMRSICWANVPQDSVFTLYRLNKEKAFALYGKGVRTITKIPKSFALTANQQVQVRANKSASQHIDRKGIGSFLRTLKYPLYYLDFETFATPIPLIDQVHPYQAVPFQFSLHIVARESAEPEHHSHLAAGPNDPRPELLRKLRGLLGTRGSIIAYNATFEKTVLKESCKAFPQYAGWFGDVEKRIVDLILPFRSFHYYHPDQHGSLSIKHVLPTLAELDYTKMAIANGTTASSEFLRVIFGKVTADDYDNVRDNLEKYCGLDTLAMVTIVETLRKLTA